MKTFIAVLAILSASTALADSDRFGGAIADAALTMAFDIYRAEVERKPETASGRGELPGRE